MNGIFLTTHAAQQNVDALNRKAVASADIANGTAVAMTGIKTGEYDVFTAAKAGAGAIGVGIACSPEVGKLVVGQTYQGDDPRYFTNRAGKVFDVVIPQKFDVFQMSIDCFVEDKDPATITGAKFIELTANGWEAVASATQDYAGVSFAILGEADIAVGNEMVKAWHVECKAN